MAGLDVLRIGAERYRIGSWRGHDAVGYLAPLSPPHHLSRAGLDLARDRLASRGYRSAFTAALSPEEQRLFRDAGFRVHERLHLLRHDLHDLGDRSRWPRLRRPWRWERAAVLAVDGAAFDPFWRLDPTSLAEAVAATPRTRFRVATDEGILGYAVTGLAADHGYLQRLAVHPEHTGKGIATALVLDALVWLRGRGANGASVNTQERNHRALSLYEHLGFVRIEPGLAVLSCELATAS